MRLILDCDPGNGTPGADIDDGLAIALALRSPGVELAAITVVAGNVPLAEGVRNTLRLLDQASRADVPVYAGAAQPLLQDPSAIRERLDRRGREPPGRDLWAGLRFPEPTRQAAEGHAALAIAREVMAHPGEVTVVAVGPLTNLALACSIEPAFARSVRRILCMGGSIAVARAPIELNFGYDPEATQMVLRSGAPLTVLPLDVTTRTCFTLADNARLAGSADPLCRYLARTCEPWIRWVMQVRNLPGCWLHDPLALAAAIDPTLVETQPLCLDMELGGQFSRGRLFALPAEARGTVLPHLPHGEPNAAVATAVENERFMALLMGRLLGQPPPP